jgi:hypothetical protein
VIHRKRLRKKFIVTHRNSFCDVRKARVRERFCSLSSSLLLFPIFFSFIARANEFTFL